MKRITYLLLLLITIIGQGCKNKSEEKKQHQRKIYVKDFNWSIIIPPNFEKVSAGDWAKIQNKGADAIENTYGERIVNKNRTIFVFKSDQINYIEANYQPFDTAIDGDYITSCKGVNETMYRTFVTQIPGTEIDTASSMEKIDGLEFLVHKMDLTYPNKMILHIFMFSKLFEKREFSVNIYYIDNLKGKLMLDAWRSSVFAK